jgi:hypothetical protein
MSLLQQLLQVTSHLLAAIKDDKLDDFYSMFSALANELTAAVSMGTASREEMVLMEKVGAAVEMIATSFVNLDKAAKESSEFLESSQAAFRKSSSAFLYATGAR